ncbi:MAG: DUF1553 domain-containing protein, partial [Verrucomicrobiales bacterium]|nr:DUF1553 domain-containing protein [Verrucomicrobiales bacterium]
VWLGLTTGCAQCHTHKYDPITHTDYYGLMALMNNADEPELQVPDAAVAERRATGEKSIAKLEAELLAEVDEAKFTAWWQQEKKAQVDWTPLKPTAVESNLPLLDVEADGTIFASGDFTKRDVFTITADLPKTEQPITALRLEALPDVRLPSQGPGRAFYEGRSGDFFLSELTAQVGGQKLEFAGGSVSYGKISIGSGKALAENVYDGDGSTGWSTAGGEGHAHELVLLLKQPLKGGQSLKVTLLFERHFVAALGKFRLSVTTRPGEVKAASAPEFDPLTASVDEARRQYLRQAPELADARKKLEALEKTLPESSTTLVMQEWAAGQTRPTFLHHRGEFLKPEERVEPAVPAVFAGLPEGKKADRLALAQWLVDAERNPLVARVAVNRAWYAMFGRGLVPTLADFGVQSELPSHPELLDWLAVTWAQEDGWSMKQLHKRLVMSATYRQDSRVTPELLAKDADNKWLARGPRFRMEAEMVRDSALRVSGLLSPKLGGPSVYPPQPPSVSEAAYGSPKWVPSPGEDRYRRSLYTFAKRTAPFAAYLTFDGPTGESCLAQRERSNSPLQALTLLNDDMFAEAARALAARVLKRDRPPEQTARALVRTVLGRVPTAAEVRDLVEYQAEQQRRLEVGELKLADFDAAASATADQVAWSMVARVLLNLDEFVTKG